MIQTLEIENLRGIKDRLTLLMEGRTTVIFGDNGTGKSSIIDGTELAMRDRIHHLEESGQQVTLKKHAHHVNATPEQIVAKLTLRDGTTLEAGTLVSGGSNAALLRNSAMSGVNILRRSHLLDAISLKPNERYKMLEPFLPLEQIKKYEETHKLLHDQLKQERQVAERILSEVEIKIKTGLSLHDSVLLTDANLMAKLHKLSEEANMLPPTSLDPTALVECLEKVKVEIHSLQAGEKHINIHTLVASLDKMLDQVSPEMIIQEAWAKSIKLQQESSMLKAVFYEDALKLGAKWITEEKRTSCPLCEHVIDPSEILGRIETRLKEHESIIKAKQDYHATLKLLKTELTRWDFTIDGLISASAPFKSDTDLIQLGDTLKQTVHSINELLVESDQTLVAGEQPNWPERMIDIAKPLKERYFALLPSQETTDKLTNLLNLSRSLELLTKEHSTLRSREKAVTVAELRFQAVGTFKTELEQQRKAKLRTIYAEVESTINEFYYRMHPDENIGDVKLSVKETGSGSTLLHTSFHGKNEQDPRGYYSESHLDTLGLSVFLALYKRETDIQPNLRVLVLDDVLHSVDAPHRRRVAEMLFTEFREHQLIITTHDRVWFNDLKDIATTVGLHANFLEIYDWTLENGPFIKDPRGQIDQLRNKISTATEMQDLAAKAGITLEYLLNQIRYSLKLAVPAKYDDRYTIADIWNTFQSCINKGKLLPGFNERHPDVIKNMATFLSTRNRLGAHYNKWADEGTTFKEVRDFAHAVLDLAATMFCSNCNRFVQVQSGVEERTCKCKQLTYHSVEKVATT